MARTPFWQLPRFGAMEQRVMGRLRMIVILRLNLKRPEKECTPSICSRDMYDTAKCQLAAAPISHQSLSHSSSRLATPSISLALPVVATLFPSTEKVCLADANWGMRDGLTGTTNPFSVRYQVERSSVHATARMHLESESSFRSDMIHTSLPIQNMFSVKVQHPKSI